MQKYTRVPDSTFRNLVLNAGIIVDGFNPATGAITGAIVGATNGGISFNSNPTFKDRAEGIDNVPPNTKELKELVSYDPTMSGTFKSVTAALAKKLAAAADIASDGIKIVPRQQLEDSDFTDLWFVGDYSDVNTGDDAGFLSLHLMNALNTTGFQIKSNKDDTADFAFEFHGHYSIDDLDTVPFEIYVKEGEHELADLTVTSVAGTASGDSKITVSGYTLKTGESYVYSTAVSTAPSVDYGDNVSTWTALTNGSDITPTASHTKITVAVKNSSNEAVAAGSATIVKNS